MRGIDLRGKDAAWMQFFQMIQEECPHCRIENLVVVDGVVSGYTRIRYSKVSPRDSTGLRRNSPEGFNAQWAWFVKECQDLGNTVIPEVHFRNGSPFALYGDKQGQVAPREPQGGDPVEPRKALALT